MLTRSFAVLFHLKALKKNEPVNSVSAILNYGTSAWADAILQQL